MSKTKTQDPKPITGLHEPGSLKDVDHRLAGLESDVAAILNAHANETKQEPLLVIVARLDALDESLSYLHHRIGRGDAPDRMSVYCEVLDDITRMLVYFAEYALWNEGRDRHAGPKPSGKIAEIRRQVDGLRKRMANGFTTNDRPNLAGVDQSDQEAVQPVHNGDPT